MMKAADVLIDPHASATSKLLVLIDELGTDFFSWEPTAFDAEVKDTWKIEMPQICKDKVWALVNYLTTNMFFTNLEVFIHTCNALASGAAVDMRQYDPATVAEISWALMETELLEAAGQEGAFSSEITAYIQKELEAEGFHKVPRSLRKFVEMPNIEEQVNTNLTADGIDYNGFWDSQQKKLIALDQALISRLLRLLEELSSLPLKNARKGAIQEIVSSARKALGEQQTNLRTAAGTVSTPPVL